MTTVPVSANGKRPNAFVRLYRGETSFDFVGRRRVWYVLSAIIIVAGLVSLTTRGLNLGIDFRGGTSWQVPADGVSVSTATKAVEAAGVPQPVVEALGTGSSTTLEIQADLSKLSVTQRGNRDEGRRHSRQPHPYPCGERRHKRRRPHLGVGDNEKAIIAVIAFFILVVLYISFRFEWKMAVAALIAVIHDLLITVGIYSLAGFQVTPDTVIAVLTILGYSLYDTVVVFDRVTRETTKGQSERPDELPMTDVVNLSMNQVLARSINTSLVAILPVLAVLVIGAELLGAATLQYFGLALVIGLTSGAYSSIFIASPILAQLKEREPRYQNIRLKLADRDSACGLLTPAAAGLPMSASE